MKQCFTSHLIFNIHIDFLNDPALYEEMVWIIFFITKILQFIRKFTLQFINK